MFLYTKRYIIMTRQPSHEGGVIRSRGPFMSWDRSRHATRSCSAKCLDIRATMEVKLPERRDPVSPHEHLHAWLFMLISIGITVGVIILLITQGLL